MIGLLSLLPMLGVALAQEHRHPSADAETHERFYSTWFMPDAPSRSCCNRQDCYPTVAEMREGQWYARRREDGEFLVIPWSKFEVDRDSPDGRSHLCAPPPSSPAHPPRTVFCFVLGGGT